MKKRVLGIFRYLLAAFLGFWTLSFMESSGLILRSVWGNSKFYSAVDMYQLIDFTIAPAVSAAAVFQLFMILISMALLALGLAQVMKLHGIKLPEFTEKVYSLRVAKKFDLVLLLALSLTLFTLLTMICLAAYAAQSTTIISATNYTRGSLGFGPVWLFIFGVLVSGAMLFEDKIVALLLQEKPLKKEAAEEEEDVPLAEIPPAAPIEEHEVTEAEITAYTAHHDNDPEV